MHAFASRVIDVQQSNNAIRRHRKLCVQQSSLLHWSEHVGLSRYLHCLYGSERSIQHQNSRTRNDFKK